MKTISGYSIEISKLHLEIMKDYHQRYGNNSLQTMAAILVAMGWMISINPGKNWIISKPIFKLFSSVVVVIIWVIHIVVSIGFKTRLRNQAQFIERLGVLTCESYNLYIIDNVHFRLNLLMNSLLFSLLLLLIIKPGFAYM